LSIATNNLLANVSNELQKVDKSIKNVVTQTTISNTEHSENPAQTENSEQIKDYEDTTNSEQQKLEESYSRNRIDWTE